jgi:hypothetical protein
MAEDSLLCREEVMKLNPNLYNYQDADDDLN